MSDYRYDIEKYKKGELTPEEMHALEKKALSDPFLADALDGLEQISSQSFSDDVNEIRRAAIKKTSKPIFTPLRIAASIIFLLSVSLVVFLSLNKPEVELAQRSEVSESPTREDQQEITVEKFKDEQSSIESMSIPNTASGTGKEEQKVIQQVPVEENVMAEIAAAPVKVEPEELEQFSIVANDEIADVTEVSPAIQGEAKKWKQWAPANLVVLLPRKVQKEVNQSLLT
ncbi:MAG: hypothetical protein HC811_07665 [Flammeovirgaceae bacterium]|nr:hypothetical protein [Flammeovirgaceae bacterium]